MSDEHGITIHIDHDKSGNDPATSISGRYRYRDKDHSAQVEVIYRHGAPEPALPQRKPVSGVTVRRTR